MVYFMYILFSLEGVHLNEYIHILINLTNKSYENWLFGS